MAKQYWVGEFFVDLSRNQISQLGQSQTLPPKALLVLTYLAENRGKVVSYDELLDTVWPNSVVTPNTLQRCIAQLRKALGENSKAQDIIKTHAKQGYSLETDVNWSEQSQATQATETENPSDEPSSHETQAVSEKPTNSEGVALSQDFHPDSTQSLPKITRATAKHNRYFWLAALTVVVMLFGILFTVQKESLPMAFSDLRYLTATDDKEYGGIYSHDGNYIIFQRYYDKVCINDIWAKNTDTLEEVRLTSERGTYSGHSLSPDGKTLTFIKEEDCTKPVTQNVCYTLMSLDFEQALSQPQSPTALLHCQNSAISKPIWIDDQHIVMEQRHERHWRLIRYSVKDNSSSPLYEVENGNIMNYIYSAERNLLAVTAIKQDGSLYIDMLSPDGELISSQKIVMPDDEPAQLKLFSAFVPNSNQLVLGSGGQLFSMSEQGQINKLTLPLDEEVGSPVFHPDGSRLLLIKGRYDSDIAKLSIPPQATNSTTPKSGDSVLSVFSRSIALEEEAKYQPFGSAIAYVSGQTGTKQVWLATDNGTSVISHFPKGSYIRHLRWAPDGNSLLVLANFKLHRIQLHANTTAIEFDYPITNLFYWDSNGQQAIASVLINGSSKFVSIDLNTLEFTSINSKRVNWATKSHSGSLIFMDHMNRIWQQGGVEDTLLEPLSGQGSSKGFVVKNEHLYGINKDDQLWFYNLQSGAFKIVATVPRDVRYLTDVKDDELLVSVLVAEKREVIELAVSK
ncbi:MAG: winged helix-turn-helix domain-containing protein [Aestuariibacter sp.]